MPARGNGLRADGYVPLADLAPPVADAMLGLLREAGVAAYAIPAGEVSGYLEARMPTRPLDRLYVDASTTDIAREVLRDRLADLTGHGGATPTVVAHGDEEAAWREIIASFDAESAEPVPPWPVSEDVDVGADQVRRPSAPPDDHAPLTHDTADDEDHFVPPNPPPVPHPDPVTAASWLSLFGGPAYLLVATILDWRIPGWAAFAAIAAFVAGFVTLVVRMGDGPPRGSGPDDGAAV